MRDTWRGLWGALRRLGRDTQPLSCSQVGAEVGPGDGRGHIQGDARLRCAQAAGAAEAASCPLPGEGHVLLPRSLDYSASESTCAGQLFCLISRPTQSTLNSPLSSPGGGPVMWRTPKHPCTPGSKVTSGLWEALTSPAKASSCYHSAGPPLPPDGVAGCGDPGTLKQGANWGA